MLLTTVETDFVGLVFEPSRFCVRLLPSDAPVPIIAGGCMQETDKINTIDAARVHLAASLYVEDLGSIR